MYILNDWQANKQYYRNDFAIYNGDVYECRKQHTGASNFTQDNNEENWRLLPTEFTGKVALTIPDWNNYSTYDQGALVLYDELLYESRINNNQSSQFDISNWNLLTDISTFRNGIPYYASSNFVTREWAKNDLVIIDGVLYRCLQKHTTNSGWSNTEKTYWELLSTLPINIYKWEQSVYYNVGTFIIYNGYLYCCIQEHQGTTTTPADDTTNWLRIVFMSNYEQNYYYNIGQTMWNNGSKMWLCIISHLSESYISITEQTNYTIFGYVYQTNGGGSPTGGGGGIVTHNVGEIQIIGNKLYYCITGYSSATIDLSKYLYMGKLPIYVFPWRANVHYPLFYFIIDDNKEQIFYANTYHNSGDTFEDDKSKWNLILSNITEWEDNKEYKKGAPVIYDDKVWLAKNDHTSYSPFDETLWVLFAIIGKLDKEVIEDADPTITNADKPVKIKIWGEGLHLEPGDIILYNGALYRVNTTHVAENFKKQSFYFNIIASDIPEWEPNKGYDVGDVILHDGNIYVCTIAHTSNDEFDNDEKQNWETYLTSKTTIPDWESNKEYKLGDLVTTLYDGKLIIFRCIYSHTSGSSFDISKWGQINDLPIMIMEFMNGKKYIIPIWEQNIDYIVDDIILHNGKLYKCVNEHTSTDFDNDIANWEEIGEVNNINAEEWEYGKLYYIDSLVIFEGKIYKCTVQHTSLFNFEPSKWQLVSETPGIKQWQPNMNYVVGDLLIIDGKIYYVNIAHTSEDTPDESKMEEKADTDSLQEIPIDEDGIPEWISAVEAIAVYRYGYVVKIKDETSGKWKYYKCIKKHDNTPSFDFELSKEFWVEIDDIGVCHVNEWEQSMEKSNQGTKTDEELTKHYKVDDVVKVYDNEDKKWKYYKCIEEHDVDKLISFEWDKPYWEEITEEEANGTTIEEGDMDYSQGELVQDPDTYIVYSIIEQFKGTTIKEAIKQDKIIPIFTNLFNDSWKPNTHYLKDEIVSKDGVIYKMPMEFITTTNYLSEFATLGGLTFLGTLFVVFEEWKPLTFYAKDKLVVYGGGLYICITEHTSGELFDGIEQENWEKVCEYPFKLIKWKSNISYKIGDIVYIEDEFHPNEIIIIAMCINDHTSAVWDDSYWKTIIPNMIEFKIGKSYPVDVVIKYGGQLIKPNVAQQDVAYDKTFCMPWDMEEYEVGKSYDKNDMVIVGDAVFRATTSKTGTIDDKDILDSIDVASIGEWEPDTEYKAGDIVIYDNKLYICNTDHHSDLESFDNDTAYWDDLGWELVRTIPIEDEDWESIAGNIKIPQWKNFSTYNAGDIVAYDGIIYKCEIPNTVGKSIRFNSGAWKPMFRLSEWKSNTKYISGEIIKYKDNLYSVIVPMYESEESFNKTGLKNLGITYDEINKVLDINHIITWKRGLGLVVGNQVFVASGIYRVIKNHIATDFNNDKDNFEPVFIGIKEYNDGQTYTMGQVVTKDDVLFVCTISHTAITWDTTKWVQVNIDKSSGSSSTNLQDTYDNLIQVVVIHKDKMAVAKISKDGFSIDGVKKYIDVNSLNGTVIPCIETMVDEIVDNDDLGTYSYGV